MQDKYTFGESEEAKLRYRKALELEAEGLKPMLKAPFVNLPPIEITPITKENILLDDAIINNIKYVSLKLDKSIGGHWHKINFHYILLMKGKLVYYEKPVKDAKGVYLNKIEIGQMFYVPPMTEHEILAEEDDSQFYIFSHLSLSQEKNDTIKSNYDIKNFPLIARLEKPGPPEYIKRF